MAKRPRKTRKSQPTNSSDTSESDDMDDEGQSRAVEGQIKHETGFSGRWTYDVQAKLTDPKFSETGWFEVLQGKDLTTDYIKATGLQKPILIEKHYDLNMKMPNADLFGVDDVKRCMGARSCLEVVEVSTQRSRQMTLASFVRYYKTRPRAELLNVLSLEFSLSKLEKLVQGPAIVKEIDWVELAWPAHLRRQTDSRQVAYPKVQNYCLMSVGGCYTDFHVDFGGTSVWYHVLKGQKTFWMVPPTPTNLRLYREWLLSGALQDDVFFGDCVVDCYRATLRAGHTFFIPSGWVHAVYTPVDSLVFGGNFLHSHAIQLQLSVYDLELKTHVQKKFRYPYFVEMMWFVAEMYVRTLTGRTYLTTPDTKPMLKKPHHSQPLETVQNRGTNSLERIDEQGDDKRNAHGLKKESHSQGESHTLPQLSELKIEQMLALTELEREGLKALGDWLAKLPPDKRDVPQAIHSPDYLVADLKAVVYNCELLVVDVALEKLNEAKQHAQPPVSVSPQKCAVSVSASDAAKKMDFSDKPTSNFKSAEYTVSPKKNVSSQSQTVTTDSLRRDHSLPASPTPSGSTKFNQQSSAILSVADHFDHSASGVSIGYSPPSLTSWKIPRLPQSDHKYTETGSHFSAETEKRRKSHVQSRRPEKSVTQGEKLMKPNAQIDRPLKLHEQMDSPQKPHAVQTEKPQEFYSAEGSLTKAALDGNVFSQMTLQSNTTKVPSPYFPVAPPSIAGVPSSSFHTKSILKRPPENISVAHNDDGEFKRPKPSGPVIMSNQCTPYTDHNKVINAEQSAGTSRFDHTLLDVYPKGSTVFSKDSVLKALEKPVAVTLPLVIQSPGETCVSFAKSPVSPQVEEQKPPSLIEGTDFAVFLAAIEQLTKDLNAVR